MPRKEVAVPQLARRAALVALLGTLVVLYPAGAWATFVAKDRAVMTAGTATLAAPSSVSVSGTCPTWISAGTLRVTFPNVALAESYTVVLDPPSGANLTRTATSGTTGTTIALPRNVLGTYTVTVISTLGSWTSTAASRSFTC